MRRSDWKLDGAGLHELKRLEELSYTLGVLLVHAFRSVRNFVLLGNVPTRACL